jgi:tetratricopeptide (TPR) repeat protein
MKRIFIVAMLLLFALLPPAFAAGADDQYVQIYSLIQQGDALSADLPAQALAKYTEAQTALQRFQKIYPTWNNQIIRFRSSYLSNQIAEISAKAPAARVIAPLPISNPAPSAQKSAAPATSEIENQLNSLRAELKQLQSDKGNLEAKLKEALSAQPTALDPAELAKADEKIKLLEKENAVLQQSLAQEKSKPVPPTPTPVPAPAAVVDTKAIDALNKELADARRQLSEQTSRASQLASENQSLQSRVKALSAEAEAVAALRSENEMLKKLAEARPTAPTTAGLNDSSQEFAKAQAQIAALQSDKEILRLEKIALQNRVRTLSETQVAGSVIPSWTEDSARVKQLTQERDDLQKKLEAAQKELYGRKKARTTVARVDELTSQLTVLRARLEVYEARQVPYTADELALFKKPETVLAVTDPKAGKKSTRELPSGTVAMVAEAQRDFAAKKFDAAEEKYLEVLRHDDRNVNTLANLATIQMELNHLDEAEKHIKEALVIAPDDAYSLSILGNLKYRQAKYDDALDALSRAAKIDPKNAEVQNYLGLTLSQKGLRAPAETALRKAIQLQPNYASAHNNLAVIYATQQPPLIELARWHYQHALASGFPQNADLEKLLEQKKEPEANP